MPEHHKHKALHHLTEGLKELRKMKELAHDKDYRKVKHKERKEVKEMEHLAGKKHHKK